MENVKQSKSKARWQILKHAVIDKKITDQGDFGFCDSVRRFKSFELFIRNQCSCVNHTTKGTRQQLRQEPCRWFCYICKEFDNIFDIWIQHPDPNITINDALSFNNTGNVCIWPTEEVMAYYCISEIEEFYGKNVIELGGGSSCLAGMAVSLNSPTSNVLVTDGNKKCVENLKEIIKMNCGKNSDLKSKNKAKINKIILSEPDHDFFRKPGSIQASVIRWDDLSTFKEHKENFDYILCADCLFFQEFHDALLDTIDYILKPGGTALIFAPKRGTTLKEFLKKCQKKFEGVTESEDYSFVITEKHRNAMVKDRNYDPNLHYPILIEISKPYTITKDDSSNGDKEIQEN